jgi:hypothetical protein
MVRILDGAIGFAIAIAVNATVSNMTRIRRQCLVDQDVGHIGTSIRL